MEKYLEYLKQPIALYSAGGVIVLLFVIVLSRTVRAKRLRARFEDYTYNYNSLKSIPLLFKLNKATALAKVSSEIKELVDTARDDFESVTALLKNLNEQILENEDLLELGKIGRVKKRINDIDDLFAQAKVKAEQLSARLDEILEQESQLRLRINKLKELYRDLRYAINSDIDRYAYCIEVIDDNMNIIEGEFTTFENAILSSEFGRASEVIEDISQKMKDLTNIINKTPVLVNKAKYELPTLLEKVQEDYLRVLNTGCNFTGIKVETTLNEIGAALKASSVDIRSGNIMNLEDRFLEYQKQLEELAKIIDREHQSLGQAKLLFESVNKTLENAQVRVSKIKTLIDRITARYGPNNYDEQLKQFSSSLTLARKQYSGLEGELIKKQNLVSNILLRLKELELSLGGFLNNLQAFNEQLSSVCRDEDEAKEQLIKLHLLINETKSLVNRNYLPSISETYNNDLNIAVAKIADIEEILSRDSLEVDRLRLVLNDAKEFIYKFYNDVNIVVGMSQMAENTIVFCNKYRKQFSDIDSDLTKAEMCFNNGEYSNSLALAIAIAQRMFPHNYADLIKEYSRL